MDFKVPSPEGKRRLPIYLVLDTSGSMYGPGIAALNQGQIDFKNELLNNTEASDAVHVGVITFDSHADFLTQGLVTLEEFKPFTFSAEGSTNLAEAFEVLNNSIETDFKRPVTGVQLGDWRALAFVFTDGSPTSDNGYDDESWKRPRELLIEKVQKGLLDVIIVGIGDVDEAKTDEICSSSIKNEKVPVFKKKLLGKDGDYNSFFDFVIKQTIQASQSVSRGINAKIDNPDIQQIDV